MREYPSGRVDLWADNREALASMAKDGKDIDTMLACLSPDELSLFLARIWERLTWDQMSARFNVPRATLQRRLDKVINKLREELS